MPDFSLAGLSAPITSVHPADSVLSSDGATLYLAGEDGKVRVYDFATRVLQATWDVGITLGGIDLSADGSFLVVTETTIVDFRSEGEYGPYYSTLRAYKVDTATGTATPFSIETQGGDHTFYDAAILADGSVLLSQSAYSAFLPLMRLDLGSGQYTTVSDNYSIRGALIASADRSHVVFTPGNISDGPILVYESGIGITHSHSGYSDGVYGYNNGISAISLAGNLIAQQTVGGSLYIYDTSLNFLVNLDVAIPGLYLGTNIAGLAFDSTGENLFILSDESDRIFQVSTADWSVAGTIPVGSDVGLVNQGAFANRLLLIDDGSGFLVTTAAGLSYVEDNRLDNDFTGSAGNDFLFAGDGTDVVSGLGGNDTIGGGVGDDVLSGGAGNDILDPGTGSDTANGGLDSDTLSIDWSGSATAVHNGAPLAANAGEGGLDGSFTNDAGLNVAFTSIERFEIIGGASNDSIDTGGGNDVLNGGGGNDDLAGAAGDDTYSVDSAGDLVTEAIGQGADSVYTSVSYTLAAGAEIETLAILDANGTTAIDLTGNGFANALIGNAGVNLLNGGASADTMSGGNGNDKYIVDNAGDVVVEGFGGGTDSISTLVDYTLAPGSYVERLNAISFALTTPLKLTGNYFVNLIEGNAGDNQLDGGGDADRLVGFGGDDKYVVDNYGDVVVEASGGGTDSVSARVDYSLGLDSHVERLNAIDIALTTPLNLAGNNFVNQIEGNAGNNLLDGRGGADTMVGFGGNDKYVVDNAGDVVVEGSGGGTDSISTLVDYQLALDSHVERLNAISAALTTPLKLTGNNFVNQIEGNAGNNTLDGRGGADALIGFGGNDKYVVDNAGDVVTELAGGGNDSISAIVDYQLAIGSHVERLNAISFALTTPLKLTGNNFVNLIEGNAGNNILDGRGGADTLVGLGGDDKYVVDNAGEVVTEGAGGGNDSVSTVVDYQLAAGSHVERLTSISWALTTPLNLTGNELANRVEGNAGNNTLDGKGGADTLAAFGGADTFAFTSALGGGNIDVIEGFVSGTDKVALDDAIFAAIGAALDAAEFRVGSAAADADDRIVYNSATGQLFYDTDGVGGAAQVQFATLTGAPAITVSDFLVI